MKHLTLIACLAVVLSCSERDRSLIDVDGVEVQGQNKIAILDSEGKTVPNAKILVGYGVDNPLKNNFIMADADGSFTPPADWKNPLPITIEAPGFMRTTYDDQLPDKTAYFLSPQPEPGPVQVKGVTKNFEPFVKNNDGWVDFAFILPLFSRKSVFFFSREMLLNPRMEKMVVKNREIYVASNISIPRQKERVFGLIGITLDKHNYIYDMFHKGPQVFVGLSGRTPMKEIMKDKPPLAMLNDIDPQGVGFTTAVVQDQAPIDADLKGVTFDRRLEIKAPRFHEEQILIITSAIEKDGGYYPTDFKTIKSEQVGGLKTLKDKKIKVLRVLTKDSVLVQLGMSVSFTDEEENAGLLDITAPPRIERNALQVQPPVNSSNLQKLGTYAVLSKLIPVTTNMEEKREDVPESFAIPQWEFFGKDWKNTVTVPEWPDDQTRNQRYRWEVLFLGTNKPTGYNGLGPELFLKATHASRNGVDL